MFVFCAPCKGQDKIGRPKDNVKSETKDVITSYGPTHITRNIIQDRKGNIWLATFEGVFRYDGKSFTNITIGVSSARFFSLLEDRQGNLWFGSIGSGVYRYDGKSLPALRTTSGGGPNGTAGFQNITTDNGLLNNEITCIYEDKAGNIWFGGGGGVSRYDGKSLPTGHAGFRNYIINGDSMMEDKTGKTFPNSPRQPYGVNDIMEDKTGKFWIATTGDTFVYDGKNFIVVARNGKPFKNVRTIIEDKKGNIWLSGNDGLWRYDGSTFTNIANNFVGFVYEDRKGTIWTSSGNVTGDWALCRYDEKSLSNKYAVVPEVIKSKEGMIFGILEANDGSIWFGTLIGVNRYDGNTITDFKKAKETK
jgi:ligand-binding sensor domain-containing protein